MMIRNAMAMALVATAGVASAQVFSEGFEGLTLGDTVDEPAATGVWTRTGPAGWTVQFNDPIFGTLPEADFGCTEFRAWSFANKDWWITTAGNQGRATFTTGTGTVAIADADEWDDCAVLDDQGNNLGRPTNLALLDTTLTSPAITVPGGAELVVEWDNSFRAYINGSGFNTGAAMRGVVTASFNVGGSQVLADYDSDILGNDTFAEARGSYPITVPAGATSMTLSFQLSEGSNDWWWAIDNVLVRDAAAVVAPAITGNPGLIFKAFGQQTPAVAIAFSETSGNAVGYTLQYSGSADFARVSSITVAAPATEITIPANALRVGRTYFRVTANGPASSATSAVASFDISQDSSSAEIADLNEDGLVNIFDIFAFFNIFGGN